jgi:ubiquinol-cytochrome c reductase cytochrome b subunit
VLWHQKHTQFAGPGRREDNIVGSRLWPTYALRSVGLFALVGAAIALLAGLAQINPVWLYGPFKAPAVSTAAQPDWYMGWLEGALRLFPAWRIHVLGYTISELLWPGVVLPGLTFGLLYLWPFLEAKVSRDRGPHHLLDRPRQRPLRTALGIATLTFYGVLMIAGSQDLIAERLGAPITSVTTALRVLLFLLPVLTGLVAWRLCHDLQRADRVDDTKKRIRAVHFGDEVKTPPLAEDSPPLCARPRRHSVVNALAAGAVIAAGVAELRNRLRRKNRV